MFLTRLPCPRYAEHDASMLARATAYFPVVGWIVGGIAAAAYHLALLRFQPGLAAIFAVGAAVVVTGAFHEDAWADVCDGFGGYTPARRLEIMRDSRVGSFGVAGLCLLLLARIAALASMPPGRVFAALLIGHAVARWTSVLMIAVSPYVTDSGSLAKPFAGKVTPGRLAIASLLGCGAALVLGGWHGVAAILLCSAAVLAASRFFRQWLGGISGDCLGAVNQFCELVCYLALLPPAR